MRIGPSQLLVITLLLITSYVLQVSLLARIGMPGAVPDLLLVVVAVLGMMVGPTAGAIIGFAAGLLVGLAPPGFGALGQTAAVYAVVGFAAGYFPLPPGRIPPTLVAISGGLCGGSAIALALTGFLLESHSVSVLDSLWLAVTAVFYGAVLAFGVAPVTRTLFRGPSRPGTVLR